MIVQPRNWQGMSMSPLQLIGRGPKFTVWCGNCPHVFQERLPPHINRPTVICPACNALNQINVVWGPSA